MRAELPSAEKVRLPWGPLGFRRVHDICGWDIEVYDTATGKAVSVTSDFETFVEVYNLFLATLNDGRVESDGGLADA